MGSSESDAAQQVMFNAKGITLIKEAVNGLVKSPESETRVLDTPKISLSNMKSRIDAALMVSAGSSNANKQSRPPEEDASSPGPSRRSGRTMILREQPAQPPLKKPKVEPQSESQIGDTPRSLRSGRNYNDSPAAQKVATVPASKTASAGVSTPAAAKQTAAPTTSPPTTTTSSPPQKPAKQASPKAGSSSSRSKQDLADPLPDLWRISPKIAEEMKM
nr:translation initiation factor IF-2-like [Rhipicephalus microplus]